MSWGWDRFSSYRAAPKLPPPKDGLKASGRASTWWARRWIEALERMSGSYSNRLPRGRSYARSGRTHDLVVKAGVVTALVTGTRPKPYQVTIRLARFGETTWRAVIEALAAKSAFAASLLAGEMPHEIDEIFATADVSLFPTREADLVTSCSCPDWANPCKHVAATHYVLADALEEDPFLLFELRGRARDQVLSALRAVRAGEDAAAPASSAARVATVDLGGIAAADYDRPRGALPDLHLAVAAAAEGGSLLGQLGAPRGWRSERAPGELLAPLVEAAARRARELIYAEPVVEAKTPKKRRGR